MEKIDSLVLALNLPKVAIMAAGSKVFIRDPNEVDGEISTDDAFNRSFQLKVNIHYCGSGDTFCLTELRSTLMEDEASDFQTMEEAAEHLKRHINQHHSLQWFNFHAKAEFILMGNISGTQKPISIFKISRKKANNCIYACEKIEEDKFFIGYARKNVDHHLNKFQGDMDPDEAFEVAFELIRDAAAEKGAGDIKLIMFDKRFSETTVFSKTTVFTEQNDAR